MISDIQQGRGTADTPPGKSARPFSVRLTESERASLTARAGRIPLGTYIRDLILKDESQDKRRRYLAPVKDHGALGRVLGVLGQSRLSSNLNQLAKAVNVGALPVDPETEGAIRQACQDIADMRGDLVRALGLAEHHRP